MSLQAAEASALAVLGVRVFGLTGEPKEDLFYIFLSSYINPKDPLHPFEIIALVSSPAAADCPETAFAHSPALLGLDLHYCQL